MSDGLMAPPPIPADPRAPVKRLIVRITIAESEHGDPEYVGTFRLPWPDDVSLEEALQVAAARACQALQAPQTRWRTV